MSQKKNDYVKGEILSTLRQIIHAIDLYSKKLARESGLTTPQLVLLDRLAGFQEMSVGELAKTVNLSNATVTGILDRLEKRGYIERTRSRNDKRRVHVMITKLGREVQSSAPSLLQENFVTEFGKLEDWEKSLIISSLQRVAHMMKAKELEEIPVLVTGPISAEVEDMAGYLEEVDVSEPGEESISNNQMQISSDFRRDEE